MTITREQALEALRQAYEQSGSEICAYAIEALEEKIARDRKAQSGIHDPYGETPYWEMIGKTMC